MLKPIVSFRPVRFAIIQDKCSGISSGLSNIVALQDSAWPGRAELGTVRTDADFDADQHAFYCARVIEIPTPRWTAYDAVRFGDEMTDNIVMVTQERAYSSSIWHTPEQ